MFEDCYPISGLIVTGPAAYPIVTPLGVTIGPAPTPRPTIVTDPPDVGVIVTGPEMLTVKLLPFAENWAASGPVTITLPLLNVFAVSPFTVK